MKSLIHLLKNYGTHLPVIKIVFRPMSTLSTMSAMSRTKLVGKTCLSSLLCFAITACTVGPNYQKPDLTTTLPAHYQQISDSQISANNVVTDPWWLIFNDPALNQLVDAALSHNLNIASADAKIKQARAQLNIVDGTSLPQLTTHGRVGRDRISRNSELLANLPLPNPNVNFTDYRAGLDASWEVDLFGHTARKREASYARLTSVKHQRDEVALRVAAEVARNVIDYRAWSLRSNNAQSSLETSQQLLDLTVLQQKVGLISEAEVSAAKTAMHQAAASIPLLQAAATASFMSITVLTDQSQEQVAALLHSNVDIPTVPNNVDFLGLPSDLLLRRPDLRRAERELAAATADIGVAIAEQYPKLTLIGSGGLDSVTPGKFTQLASSYWNFGPQISIPLFAGGRLAAQVKSQEAARDAALADYRHAVLAAFADTETALIRYQREQQRLTQISQAFTSQHHQLELAEKRYQVGETDFATVLQSRQQLTQIHEQQLASQQVLAGNLTTLFKSLGGRMTNKKLGGDSYELTTPIIEAKHK